MDNHELLLSIAKTEIEKCRDHFIEAFRDYVDDSLDAFSHRVIHEAIEAIILNKTGRDNFDPAMAADEEITELIEVFALARINDSADCINTKFESVLSVSDMYKKWHSFNEEKV